MIRFDAYHYSRGTPLLLLIAALVLGYPGAKAQAPEPTSRADTTPAGNAQNGKKLYKTYGCYQCHGHEAQGSVAGPRLGPRPLPFSAFARFTRQPSDQMPPYTSKVVSDSEVADIYAFLQSLPQPPVAKNIPLLND
ncbi:MAG: cytochrome c [Acidobacteria bacterium]|nr:cytochrome c [Acidobacteriota bacterium]